MLYFVARMSAATSGTDGNTGPGYRFAHPGYKPSSVQAAEGVDQDQNRNRHAEQPQQKITSHKLLHRWFDGLIRSGCTCSDGVKQRVGWAKRLARSPISRAAPVRKAVRFGRARSYR